MRIPLILFFISMAGGCVQSDHALADPDQAKVDERLLGQWLHKSPKDNSELLVTFGKPKPGAIRDLPAGLLEVKSISRGADNEMATELQCGISVKIGDDGYLNFLGKDLVDPAQYPQWKKENIKSSYFYKYTVEGDVLSMWIVDPTLTEVAINKGRLKGVVKKGTIAPDVRITEPTEGIVNYLRMGGNRELFKDELKLTFRRTKS